MVTVPRMDSVRPNRKPPSNSRSRSVMLNNPPAASRSTVQVFCFRNAGEASSTIDRSDRLCSLSRFSTCNSRSTAKALWWQAKLIFSTKVVWSFIFDASWSDMPLPLINRLRSEHSIRHDRACITRYLPRYPVIYRVFSEQLLSVLCFCPVLANFPAWCHKVTGRLPYLRPQLRMCPVRYLLILHVVSSQLLFCLGVRHRLAASSVLPMWSRILWLFLRPPIQQTRTGGCFPASLAAFCNGAVHTYADKAQCAPLLQGI